MAIGGIRVKSTISQTVNTKVTVPNGEIDVNYNPRKQLGVYYTPDALAGVLAAWALATGKGNVLDPSYGGCAFLNAAVAILDKKGIPNPGETVFGIDVDPICMEYARSNRNLNAKNCIIGDFLTLRPTDIPGAPFNAIVGNPPYVRHHWFNRMTSKENQAALSAHAAELPKTSNAWAYFVIHSLSFLAENGRLAMLVPEAVLQADYAVVIRNVLKSHFRHVNLIHIRDRQFEGTDEAVVVVAASGFGDRTNSVSVENVEKVTDLAVVLNSPSKIKCVGPYVVSEKGRRIDSHTFQILNELEKHPAVTKIRNFSTVRIGLVTGSNRHFIRNVEDLEELGVPCKSWVELVSRTRWISGLEFTEDDLHDVIYAKQRAVMVRPTPSCEKLPGVRRWIDEGVGLGIDKRYKCSIRDPWFRVVWQPVPDVFATCSRLRAPLLIVNQARCQCTNALHALYMQRNCDIAPRDVALGFLTSAVSVWAELHGRRYGGGVLKMEPGTLSKTPVPIIRGVESEFDELDKLIRNGSEGLARSLSDDLILRGELGLSKKDVLCMQAAQNQLMEQRRPA